MPLIDSCVSQCRTRYSIDITQPAAAKTCQILPLKTTLSITNWIPTTTFSIVTPSTQPTLIDAAYSSPTRLAISCSRPTPPLSRSLLSATPGLQNLKACLGIVPRSAPEWWWRCGSLLEPSDLKKVSLKDLITSRNYWKCYWRKKPFIKEI